MHEDGGISGFRSGLTDEAIVKRSQKVYARGRNVGQLAARVVEPGLAEVELTGWPDVWDRQLRTISISNEIILEMAGRRDVRQRWERTPGGARFTVRWLR